VSRRSDPTRSSWATRPDRRGSDAPALRHVTASNAVVTGGGVDAGRRVSWRAGRGSVPHAGRAGNESSVGRRPHGSAAV